MELVQAGITINKRDFASSLFLFFYLLAFYGVITILIPNLFFPSDIRLSIKIALNLTICISILLGSIISKRINKAAFVYCAPLILILLSFLLFAANGFFQVMLVLIMAAIFGSGILLSFQFFKDVTTAIERGRIAGIMAFLILPTVFFLELIPLNSLNYLYFPILTVTLNLGSFFAGMKMLQRRKQIVEKSKRDRVEKYFEKRVVVLYSIPWILFSIVNVTIAQAISSNVITNLPASQHISLIGLQTIGVCLGAVLAGFLTDFYGRRITLIVSLTLYGISAVAQGIFYFDALSIGYFINGTSWGLLFVLYFFVIFGDLSNNSNTLKMYAIGLFTYFFATTIGQIYQVYLPDITISSLLTCLIIFLSIIPVFIAPELMSSEFIYNLKIKRHMKSIKKYAKN